MTIWPLALYFAAVLLIVAIMLSLSWALGQRHSEPATGSPFESGIVSQGSVHIRLSVRYYLIATFFLVFDLESIFIFLWAIAGRELGWTGYGELLIFTGVLVTGFAYLWRTGALDWSGEIPGLRKKP